MISLSEAQRAQRKKHTGRNILDRTVEEKKTMSFRQHGRQLASSNYSSRLDMQVDITHDFLIPLTRAELLENRTAPNLQTKVNQKREKIFEDGWEVIEVRNPLQNPSHGSVDNCDLSNRFAALNGLNGEWTDDDDVESVYPSSYARTIAFDYIIGYGDEEEEDVQWDYEELICFPTIDPLVWIIQENYYPLHFIVRHDEEFEEYGDGSVLYDDGHYNEGTRMFFPQNVLHFSCSLPIVEGLPYFRLGNSNLQFIGDTLYHQNKCLGNSKWYPLRYKDPDSVSAFFPESQLNGSHGEYTNGDDMNVNDANKRINREANNRLHSKHPERNQDSHNAGRRVNNKKCSNEITQVVEQIIVPVKKTIVVRSASGWGFDGVEYFKLPEDNGKKEQYFIHNDVAIWIVPNKSLQFNITKVSSRGIYNSETAKGSTVIVSPAIVSSLEIGVFPGLENPDKLYVDLQFLKDISTKFPSSNRDNEHSIAALRSYYVRSYSEIHLPISIATDTIEFFLYRAMSLDISLKNGKLLKQGPEYRDNMEAREMARLGVSSFGLTISLKKAVNCDLVDEYLVRDDYRIDRNKSKGYTGGGLDDPYYKFNTAENAEPKYYRTVMSEFSGDFLLYDVNGMNACKALKRMFGTYKNNEIYRFFQYNLWDIIARNSGKYFLNESNYGEHTREFLSTMRVSITDDLFIVGNGRHHHETPRFYGSDSLWVQDQEALDDYGVLQTTGSFTSDPAAVPLTLEMKGNIQLETGISNWDEVFAQVRKSIGIGVRQLSQRCTRGFLETVVDGYKNLGNWGYYTVYSQYLTYLNMYDSRSANVDMHHVKRALRRSYFKSVQLHDDLDTLVQRLEACVKKEFAKPGKVPRLFVSYGAGGIYSSELPEYIKNCIHGCYELKGSTTNTTIYIMSKARDGEMDSMFRKVFEVSMMPGNSIIVIYSDDSMFVGNIRGKVYMYNLDISSCDASNRFPIFQLVGNLLSDFSHSRALGLISQCCKPMTLVNPSNRDETLSWDFDGPFEGSGTLLTTINNHCASFMIACSIHAVINCGLVEDKIEECIRIGALMVGHKLTVDEALQFENLQFLKRSPIMALDGMYYSCLNYGTIFRGFGTLEGDMQAEQLGLTNLEFKKMSWQDRMDKFLSVVVMGLKHEPRSRLLDALEKRFVDTSTEITSQMRAVKEQHYLNTDVFCVQNKPTTNTPRVILDEISLQRRYKFEEYEISQLCENITSLRLGAHISSSACEKFFQVDYGA